MSELVIRVVVEQAQPAAARPQDWAAVWAPKGGPRAVTPAPKYGIGKTLFRKPDHRHARSESRFKVAEIRIHATGGVRYYDWNGNGYGERDVAGSMDEGCKRWRAKDLPERA